MEISVIRLMRKKKPRTILQNDGLTVRMLLKLPFHDAGKHWRRTTAAQTNTHSRFDSPIALLIPALSSGSALRSPCISVSPLPNSLQTFTHSQLLLCCSLSLISQGSAPGCLQLLLAAYFARGLFPHVSSRLLRFSPAPSTSLQGGVAPTSPPPHHTPFV